MNMAELRELLVPLIPNPLFVTISGAHLYGFPSVDSDIDLRGCYGLSLAQVAGLFVPNETIERTLAYGNIPADIVAHDLGKYLRLLIKHNGYILEQIFSPLIVQGDAFLAELRPLALRCVTRNCYRHYRGFLQSERLRLEKSEVKAAKGLLYAYRVALTGIHLLRTGRIEPHLPTLNEEFKISFISELIARKAAAETGGLPELDWEFHHDELVRWEDRLAEAHAASTLPEEPPVDEVNQFLLRHRGVVSEPA